MSERRNGGKSGAEPPSAVPTFRPSVVFTDVRGKPRIVATDAEAARRGVACSMALTQAKALASDLVALPWDDERISRAALEVTTALLAASPRVAWGGGALRVCASARLPTAEGAWWVDAAGLGDEAKLARKLLRIARGLGYGPVRVGVADAAIAAYAATYGGKRGGAGRAIDDGGRRGRVGGSPQRALTGRSKARPRPDERPVVAVVPSGRDAAF
ncbi:MAG: hypothetical protein Q8Q85_06770, partial [Gemmatimonadales bacterium]|nr:hypothetical protein [Gemmatimonadales bacterium]